MILVAMEMIYYRVLEYNRQTQQVLQPQTANLKKARVIMAQAHSFAYKWMGIDGTESLYGLDYVSFISTKINKLNMHIKQNPPA